jgi:hypothetical protein
MRINPLRRREFITSLAGAAAWPFAARAQQPERMRRIDVLMAYAESYPEGQALVAAFREGLQKLGWTENRNIRIDTRWAAADVELMQRFAREIVELRPDLILTQNTPTTAAMLQQTRFAPGPSPSHRRRGCDTFRVPGDPSLVGGFHARTAARHVDCVGGMAAR